MDKKVKTEEIKTGVMPGMSENRKTSAMPGMSENRKTSAMPGMSENRKTSTMPGMSENAKTSALPNMSENRKTSAMPNMSENRKTGVMPNMSENKKTCVMPNMSENAKTSALPGMSENAKTSALPNMLENGKNNFENGAVQENTRKFYGNNDNNNVSTERIIVNDRGDKHYRTIGDYFNEGGEAGLCHVECIETNKRYVAKIYFDTRRYNKHIDEFSDAVKPDSKDGLMEICDRGFVEGHGNRAYILPDYSGKENLFKYLENHTLSEEKIIELIKNISESLNTMHIKGYYHRDIKPDNILYGNLERPIIIDYGIVTSANLSISEVAVTETVKGTRGYIPPEFDGSVGESVSSGDRKIEVMAVPKYDFFQLGVVICDIYCSMYAGMGIAKRMFISNKETSISCRYAKFKFPPNLEKNQRMVNLVRALLRFNFVERAGYKEVMAWLDGAVLEVDSPTEKDKKSQYMYQFDSKDCYSEQELARAMALSWKKGIEEVIRGRLGENYKNKLGMDYKSSSDRISNIEYDYENISPDISKHAALAEIVALLGKNMAFAWKGRIYEDENGNTDYRALADELYKDAESADGNEFDELVSSRALKELLYHQIRFVDENSSDADKQNVNYYGCMKNIEYLNDMAKKSIRLAKYYLAELCYKNSENEDMDSYIISAYTNGKTGNLNDFIKFTFSSDNIDQAMKILNTNDGETGSPVLEFLDEYKESERLKACIMSVYGLDYKMFGEIRMDGTKVEQVLELIVLLAFCDEENNNIIGIRDIFMQTCYVRIICDYIKEKNNWRYIDSAGNTKAGEYKKRLDHGEGVLKEELKGLEDYKVFCGFVRNLYALQNLITDLIEIFVYDKRIVESGMLLCTKMDEPNAFINSAVIAESERSNLCIVDGNFLIPRGAAEEYCKGKFKIENPKPQENVARQSVASTYEYVKRFENAFKRLAGKGLNGLLSKSRAKVVLDFAVAFLVVLSGIGLVLSGITFATGKQFNGGELSKSYMVGIVILDIVSGCIFAYGCRSDIKDTWDNLKLYKKNCELAKRCRMIEAAKNKLEAMAANNRIDRLNPDEKEIAEMSGMLGNGATAYFEKYNLQGINTSYNNSRTVSLIFVAAVAVTLFTFNHIPAKKVLGAMRNNNIVKASEYSKENKSLPGGIRGFDAMVTKGVLYITESNADKKLINEYNDGDLSTKQYKSERQKYYDMCDSAGYVISKKLKNTLNTLDISKSEYKKGSSAKAKGKKEKAVMYYLNVISRDSNYVNAQKYLNKYLKTLYKKQQEYIRYGNVKQLKKIAKKYKKMCKEGNKNSKLEEMYKILKSGSNADKMAEKLVALQLSDKGKEWSEDKVTRISCKKGSEKGKYYVKIQKKNSGLSWLFSAYDSEYYLFNTYGYELNPDIPENIEFEPQNFKPDSDSSYYEKILSE